MSKHTTSKFILLFLLLSFWILVVGSILATTISSLGLGGSAPGRALPLLILYLPVSIFIAFYIPQKARKISIYICLFILICVLACWGYFSYVQPKYSKYKEETTNASNTQKQKNKTIENFEKLLGNKIDEVFIIDLPNYDLNSIHNDPSKNWDSFELVLTSEDGHGYISTEIRYPTETITNDKMLYPFIYDIDLDKRITKSLNGKGMVYEKQNIDANTTQYFWISNGNLISISIDNTAIINKDALVEKYLKKHPSAL